MSTMDREQARRILITYRLGEAAPHGSELAEALAVADRDPELSAWLEAQLRFDRTVRTRVRSVVPPTHLRAAILSQPPRRIGPSRWATPLGWALAAALALMSGTTVWLSYRSESGGSIAQAASGPATSDSFRKAMATLLTDGVYSLQVQSTSLEELRRFIATRGGSANAPIPSSLEALNSLGCQVFSWNGHQATLICFTSSTLGLVHLVILEGSLPDAQGNAPVLAQASGWNTALWQESGRTYLLCARVADAELHRLVGG
jgi:hypothetical protein